MLPNRSLVRLVSILRIPESETCPKVGWPPEVQFALGRFAKRVEIAGKTHGFYVHNRFTEDPRRSAGNFAEPVDV